MQPQCDTFLGLHLYDVFIALGDAILKVPVDLAMWGTPIHHTFVDEWAQGKHTPTYISSTPPVTRLSIRKGDVLVFASDGLRSPFTEQGLPDREVGKMVVSLAGMNPPDREALLSCEKTIGHSFVPPARIDNVADGVIRNILFGLDDLHMAKETMDSNEYSRDDMSPVVVHIV